ncbi:MAG: hypothetical protein M0R21_01035 [Lentimicrobiaceae bacterium]|jgi:hypothetical protein|nr:hypothetical protein [Lentimicrobiaceae bacterium]
MKINFFTMIAAAMISLQIANAAVVNKTENSIPPSYLRLTPATPIEARFDEIVTMLEPFAFLLQAKPEIPSEAPIENAEFQYLAPEIPTTADIDTTGNINISAPEVPSKADFDE